MRDATIHYLQKSFDIVKDLISSGNKSDIFGNSSEDIVFTKSGIFTDLVPQTRNRGILEFRNVTIPSGISILGNSSRAGYTSGIGNPFYLKVNGTLTVNGVLNMNGCGMCGYGSGGFHHNRNAYYGIYYSQTGLSFGEPYITISEQQWDALKYIGGLKPFFNGQTYFVGAGISRTYKWKRATKMRYRRAESTSTLNTGGHPADGRHSSGGGGGFLALYYENLDYQGPTFQGAPLHINANGGRRDAGDGGPQIWGGGMMVIAAKNIVVGPNGYICCNPSDEQHRSYNSPNLGDSDLNAGGMALMNRKTMVDLRDYNYGKPSGYSNQQSGGPGFCVGYQVLPEFRGQNR